MRSSITPLWPHFSRRKSGRSRASQVSLVNLHTDADVTFLFRALARRGLMRGI